jgi:hypothetical protein
MQNPREAILIRLVSAAIIIFFIAVSPYAALPITAVSLGQGHFILAYLYQAKGGHFHRAKLILLLVSGLAIIAVGYYVSIAALAFINGVGFVAHFSIDEARFWGGKHSLYTTLESLPFITIVTGIFAEGYLIRDWFRPIMVIAAALALVYVVVVVYKWRSPNITSYALYVWTVIALVSYFYVRFAPARAAAVFWVIALMHFLIWYGFYLYKLRGTPSARTFLFEMLAINIPLIVLAVIWDFTSYLPVLGLVFGVGYYFWALLHGISSLRPKEAVVFFRLKT